jgi:protein tyrosine/serine phosphatase
LSITFLSSDNPKKDYQLFRKQIMTINKNLKEIYLAEKNLVNQMKKY